MTDQRKLPSGLAPFTKGDPRINRTGRPQKWEGLADAAEVSYRWLSHVAAGTDGQFSRAAMRAALKEAFELGRAMPDDMPQERIDEDLETLFERHFAEVMVARSTEKVDKVRVVACIELIHQHYGKPQVSVDLGGDSGNVLVELLRGVVIPAKPSAPLAEKKEPEG